MRRPDDEDETPEVDEFTRRRRARMSFDELWREFQDAIAEYNERNRKAADQ